MRIIRFCKIDWMIIGLQRYVFLGFAALSLLVSLSNGDWMFGLLYIGFGHMVLSTMPFYMRKPADNGFLLMLPASKKERVLGRFLYGISMYLALLLTAVITVAILMAQKKGSLKIFLMILAAETAAVFLVMAVQYTFMYAFGEMNSQQLMGIIRIVPGMVFLFGGSYILQILQEIMRGKRESYQFLINALSWISEHMPLCSFLAVVLGMLLLLVGIGISVKIVEKRDFA